MLKGLDRIVPKITNNLSNSQTHKRSRLLTAYILAAAFLLQQLAFVIPASGNELPSTRSVVAPTELFFSEYIEGSSNNKALEIYNGTGSAINLATEAYNIQVFFNGATTATAINLTGTVASGDVFVFAASAANAAILAQADQTTGSALFNGDDAIALRKGTTVIDVVGQIGLDPGTEWGTGVTSTADNTLQRKSTVCTGDINGADAFDPAAEYNGFAVDTVTGLGSHSVSCGVVSTNPSGTGAANPSSRLPGESSLLTVAVSPGTNPTSTGITVAANLTGIGGNANQAFLDDGLNGDATAGDNTFSYQATVAPATTAGTKNLPVTITDAQLRTGSANITLTVTVAGTAPTVTGSSSPSTVQAGNTSLLTATVTPGTAPASTGLAVTANLSTIGGSATQAFFDNGTNGDVTPSDNVFSYNATVTAATTAGAKSLPVTATDAETRTGTTTISLTVTAAPATGQPMPFIQNWSNTSLITTNDVWSGVPGIVGYRGDDLTTATGTDPQTLLMDGSSTPVSVFANQTNPDTFNSGAPAEFEIANPVVSIQGSGTGDAPHLVVSVNTTGANNITVTYNLRDLDGSADNAAQAVALHYRIGSTGNFVNVPGAFVADATTGGSATLVTPVGVVLPPDADNQPLVQLRIMTTNAVGIDESVGIDDINVVSNGTLPLSASGSADPILVNAGSSTLLKVSVNPGTNPASTEIIVAANLSTIGGSAAQAFLDDGLNGDAVAGDNIFSYSALVPVTEASGNRVFSVSVGDAQARTASTSISITVREAANPQVHLTMGNPSGAVTDANFPENYLLLKDQYAMSYHRDRGTPNWVSWHLDASWLGGADRQDDFRPDTTLPAGWYQVTETDYSGSGFDRGHHTPSGDRTATIPDNSATFLMTNMMPQAPDNNQGPWEQLESFSRTLVGQGNELYIVMGGIGSGGVGSVSPNPTTTVANGKVTVPSYTWKVMIIQPSGTSDVSRVTTSTRTIAVIMPNRQGIRADAWQKYLATVDQVEALTGYDFFSNVPVNIQAVIESQLDTASNTGPQPVTGGTVANLVIDFPNSALTGTVTVTGNLRLGGSTLTTGANRIILGPSATVTRISGYVIGDVEKQFADLASPLFEYPVGTVNGYSPVTAQLTALGISPSSLTVAAIQGVHPNAPDTRKALKRYWDLEETGDLTANLTFKYLDADIPPFVTDESSFKVQRYTGVFTEIPSTGNIALNTRTTSSGISEFSDWTMFGELSPSAAGVAVSGRVTSGGRGVANAVVVLIDGSGNQLVARTGSFGYYQFMNVPSGRTYVGQVQSKRYVFESRAISIDDQVTDLDFAAMQ